MVSASAVLRIARPWFFARVAGLVLGLMILPAALGAPAARPGPASSVGELPALRSALGRGGYPWYDARTGRIEPVLPQPDFETGLWKRVGDWLSGVARSIGGWFRWLNGWGVPGVGGLGDLVAIGLALLFLTLVLVGLLELLRRYRPPRDTEAERRRAIDAAEALRVEGLPAGVSAIAADPWAEAQRLRARGDYAGAIVHLFAHQLLSLERAGRLRLVPGRTGRQLVRSVADRALRGTVEPTLRLFEAVYYGHQAPSAEAFEAAWSRVETFERLLTTGAMP